MARKKDSNGKSKSLSKDILSAFDAAKDGETIYLPSSEEDSSATRSLVRVLAGRYRKLNGLNSEQFNVKMGDGKQLHGRFCLTLEYYNGFDGDEFSKAVADCVKKFFSSNKHRINKDDIALSSVETTPLSVKINVSRKNISDNDQKSS
jgi:hypothetical protein